MNDYEAERIAAAINVLRPDWPTRSLITLLGRPQLASRPRRDVLVALAWVAAEPNTANPGRVLEAGPWWKAAAAGEPTASTRYPAKAGSPDECRTHPGEWANTCRACAGDRLAGERETGRREAADPGPVAARVAELRRIARGAAMAPETHATAPRSVEQDTSGAECHSDPPSRIGTFQ